MLNRFKNKLANIVNGISSYQTKDVDTLALTPHTDAFPFPYTRPAFLNLSTDEVQVSADHISRPILVPRNGSSLPWCAGYAEVINAGKTKVSEDQARAETWTLPRRGEVPQAGEADGGQTAGDNVTADGQKAMDEEGTPVHYFGIFDGHAGTGAALMAVNILHLIIQDKMLEVQHLLDSEVYSNSLLRQPQSQSPPTTPPFSPPADTSSPPHDNLFEPQDSNENVDEKLTSDTSDNITDGDLSTADSEKPDSVENPESANLEPMSTEAEDKPKPEEDISDMETENSISSTEAASAEESTATESPDGGSEQASPNGGSEQTSPNGGSEQASPNGGSEAAGSSNGSQEANQAGPELSTGRVKPIFALNLEKFNVENMIIGALESSFFDMDAVICRERRVYRVPGGCTALVALFFKGKLYVCNAGDSRAVLCTNNEVMPISQDFTPETDRKRIQLMAWHHPELLCNMFSPMQFAHRVTRKDIGKRVLYRDGWRRGWSYKTVTDEDIKIPLIFGEGKKARLLGTIGVSRGFGDHDLRVYDTDVFVKPFMTCAPEVRIYDLSKETHTEDDVLILGTDGLWDVTTNDKAASIVRTCLAQFKPDDPNRYVSAAQELVMHARGILKGGWRTSEDRIASGDDITAFVIPLLHKDTSKPTEPMDRVDDS